MIARAQNDASRGASELSRPTSALPHWRSSSTKLITAIGAPQIAEASADDVVVDLLGRGVEDRQLAQRGHARRFVAGHGEGHETLIGMSARGLYAGPRSAARRTLPLAVLGSSAAKSTTRGYL